MNKIKFFPTSYWDRATMSLSDPITSAQWASVEVITSELNIKYYNEIGCNIHPDKAQRIGVNIFNGYVEMLIHDTCRCHTMVDRLWAIIDLEKSQRNGDKQQTFEP